MSKSNSQPGIVTFIVSLFSTLLLGAEPFKIKVIDAENQWPVPLVELRTTHHVRLVTDNEGLVAFDLPELMGRETWLHIEGHGYSVPEDGFGYRGLRITPRPGETMTIKVHRKLPAKRLARITGGALFAESQKLGKHLDWKDQGILGCDSVQNAVHKGRLFWAWGDTTLPHYPLGRFHMIGATSALKPISNFKPPIRLQYDYFVDDNHTPRHIAKMPGVGPTWLSGFASIPDQTGNYRLVATYSKIRGTLEEYERGLCVWNEKTEHFDKVKSLWKKTKQQPKPLLAPQGHPVMIRDASETTWILFGDPFPSLKCVATFESWSNPQSWIHLSPQKTVATRKSNTPIRPHRGAIAWNDFRHCWVSVFTQLGGDASYLGELWYAEADSPEGLWGDAVKIVTHNQYSFYNPKLHPEFTDKKSPILLFEATYTRAFSKTETPTPRHDYNQILYRIDLDSLESSKNN
jgi:hypothetical protein